MKKTTLILTCVLVVCLLAGCAGTPVVYYNNCTCPTGSHDTSVTPSAPPVLSEGAVKTGLYIGTKLSESSDASANGQGQANFDVTLVAVTVDDNGIIQSCVIDSIPATVSFDAAGAITSDPNAEILTKNELGENYGMSKSSPIGREWDEQVAFFAQYAVGKTVDELKNGAINESGYAADADLASGATINLFPYIFGIEAAVNNAQHLGAQSGDELHLASISSVGSSKSAADGADGVAQLDSNIAALTLSGETITSCSIDAIQATISFNAEGIITTDLQAAVLTKNQLGENYGMSKYSPIGSEWNEQTAAFCRYVTGKTAAEVAGIALTENAAPADADLASSVSIKINGFQDLIAKAIES